MAAEAKAAAEAKLAAGAKITTFFEIFKLILLVPYDVSLSPLGFIVVDSNQKLFNAQCLSAEATQHRPTEQGPAC